MQTTTASEYVRWMKHIHEEEWEHHPPLHYYLAQIACEIYNFRQSFMKTPKWKNVEEFLVKFKPAEEIEQAKQEQLAAQESIDVEAATERALVAAAQAKSVFAPILKLALAGEGNNNGYPAGHAT